MARGWSSLDSDKKDQFSQRFEQLKRAAEVEKEVGVGGGGARQTVFDGETRHVEADEDTEMVDDTGTPGGAEVGGFTAVNKA